LVNKVVQNLYEKLSKQNSLDYIVMLGGGNKNISIDCFFQDEYVSRSGIEKEDLQLVIRRLEEKNILKMGNDEQVVLVPNNMNSSF